MAALALAASTPFMAYHGTRAAGVSTNPISIAVPGGVGGPVVLDMATGVVARGKLLKALPQAPGVLEVLMPGARGSRTLAERTRHGIPLPRAIVDELRGVAARFGVTTFRSAS
jgi:LDH2 family malate/lactate/ureidoglycolate dehydrogenase